MKQSTLLYVGVIVIVLVGALFVISNRKSTSPSESRMMQQETTPAETSGTGAMMQESPTGTSGAMMKTADAKNTFTVTGSNFSFDVKEIKVKKGDTVTVVFKNADGFHDWNLDEFNAHSKKIQGGAEDTITFTADKTGTFEYYCSVGKHRQMGMVGKLIVE